MRRRAIVVGCVCAMAVASCGSSDGEPGSSESAGSYVLLDPEARQAGLSLEMGGKAVTSALPVAVSSGTKVTLVGPEQNEALEVGAGEVVYVEGAHPTVTHLKIGKQIESGELRLLGDAHAASDLASQLGANVDTTSGELRLHSPSVFAVTSGAHVPDTLVGVAPVMLTIAAAPAATAKPPSAVYAPLAVAPSTVRASAPAIGLPSPTVAAQPDVGAPAPRVQTELPATFTPATTCNGVTGTWRGRAYSQPHMAYYDFTLHVREQGSGVSGTVVAEFWSASTDEVDPPQTCSGSQHVKVFESGTGTVDPNGTMHFVSKSWRVNNHLCGQRVTAYSPDKFDLPSARGGSTSDGILSDDLVWTDGLPMKLTRVSCQ